MRSSDIVAVLEYEAKRRPHIAALLARAIDLTDEEIEAADVPLAWYRKALTEARKRAQIRRMQEYAKASPGESIDTSANSVVGSVIEYSGDYEWVKTATGIEMQIKAGDWFFLPETGGAWLNNVFFKERPAATANCVNIDAAIVTALAAVQGGSSTPGTRHEYVKAYKENLNKLMPTGTLDVDASVRHTSGGYGFRIS